MRSPESGENTKMVERRQKIVLLQTSCIGRRRSCGSAQMSSTPLSNDEGTIYYPLSNAKSKQSSQKAEFVAGQLRGYVTSLMREDKDGSDTLDTAIGRRLIPLVTDKPPIYQEARRRRIKESKQQRVKGAMNSKERRSSGLFMLPKHGLYYEDFIPLNLLWQNYIQDASAGIDLNVKNATQLSQRLVKIDLHGAFLTVTRSKVPSLIGTSGIILYESQETFKIITLTNKCVTLPKRGSIFLIQNRPLLKQASPAHEVLRELTESSDRQGETKSNSSASQGNTQVKVSSSFHLAMTIYGDHFAYRSFDRAVRKFKCLGSITIR